jgi:hypothetical protein
MKTLKLSQICEGFHPLLPLFRPTPRFLRRPFLTCPRAPQRTHRLVSVRRQGVLKMAQRAIVLTETKGWLQSIQQNRNQNDNICRKLHKFAENTRTLNASLIV